MYKLATLRAVTVCHIPPGTEPHATTVRRARTAEQVDRRVRQAEARITRRAV